MCRTLSSNGHMEITWLVFSIYVGNHDLDTDIWKFMGWEGKAKEKKGGKEGKEAKRKIPPSHHPFLFHLDFSHHLFLKKIGHMLCVRHCLSHMRNRGKQNQTEHLFSWGTMRMAEKNPGNVIMCVGAGPVLCIHTLLLAWHVSFNSSLIWKHGSQNPMGLGPWISTLRKELSALP